MKKNMCLNVPIPFGSDPNLDPFAPRIAARRSRVEQLLQKLTGNKISISDFASGHEYFGLHKTKEKWIFREWAPNASSITLVGDFSNWEVKEEFRLTNLDHGVKELELPADALHHGMHYAMLVEWPGGSGLRIPAFARKVSQDEKSRLFTAMVWEPEEKYLFKHPVPPRPGSTLIYEAHPGMAQEEEKIGTFKEFREKILPKIAAGNYNTLQLMGVVNHPYYASFGYHVANFFAIADRFGTPEEFKELVDAAHGMGSGSLLILFTPTLSATKLKGWRVSTAAQEPISTKGSGGSIPPGILSVSTTQRQRCSICCFQTAASGLRSTMLTDSALTASPVCSTLTTA